MKNILCLSVLMLTATVLYAQGGNQGKPGKATDNKAPQEIRYKEGASGVKRSINYRFDPSTSDSDPGTGAFRYNSESISGVSYLFVNDSDLSGENQSKWYKTWDDTTGAAGRGRISIVEYQGKTVNVFDVSGVFTHAGGFWKIPVEYVSGSRPAAGAIYYYVFQRIAHKKEIPERVRETVTAVNDTIVSIVSEVVQPTEQPKPVEETKPVEQPKPAEETKPVGQPTPVKEAKPVEQSKPAEEAKPVEQTKPVENVKPAEQPKPEANPVEKPKPLEEKPATQSVVNDAQPRARTQTQKQTIQVKQTTAQTGNPATQPIQKSGTTWTSQVTQGIQPSQEPPAQSYQNTQDNRLPSYGYNFSSGKRGHGKCYAGIIEVGYGFGMGDYGLDNFRFNFINGFHIGPTFTLGLGIGVRRYYPEHESSAGMEPVSKVQIPVFVDLRKTFSTRTITPYIALDLGGATRYSSGSQSEEAVNEGLMINPSGGIWINLSSRFAIFAGIGYEVQKMEFSNTSHDSYNKKNANSVSLNLGLSF